MDEASESSEWLRNYIEHFTEYCKSFKNEIGAAHQRPSSSKCSTKAELNGGSSSPQSQVEEVKMQEQKKTLTTPPILHLFSAKGTSLSSSSTSSTTPPPLEVTINNLSDTVGKSFLKDMVSFSTKNTRLHVKYVKRVSILLTFRKK